MNIELERRARDVFVELCKLPPDECDRRLEEATAEDPELRRIVSELLAEVGRDEAFLEQPVLGDGFRLSGPYAVTGQLDDADGDDGSGSEQHPEFIGPYRILGVIGSGGMGIVYRAEQQHPRREVALKVLRTGLHGPRAQRYFEHEVEALGRLHHVGIAQIFEAGTADFGRGAVPFLAMERVAGVDLSRYLRQQAPGLRARVKLLEQVCRAVHHAHQNQVIHRDIKPGNVLVTEAGEPKVIDFGLAHLSDLELSLTGNSGDVLGTLSYMSPEQVAGDASQIDASTDVYALGATAYEVLAGRRAFQLEKFTLPAALKKVALDDPESLHGVAPQLPLDLVAVIEQAMSREKGARYPSAAELAEDLQRWLNDEPVLARPVGVLEQLRKFTRRNRLLVGSVAAVVLALVIGIVATTTQARDALAQAERAQRIQSYLEDTLRSAGEPRTDGRELKVSHILDVARGRLAVAFADDPATRADLQDTLGMSYYENSYYETAERLVRAAFEWRQDEFGPEEALTLASRNNLGIVLIARDQLGEAELHLRAAHRGRLNLLGEEHEDTQRSANWLGYVLLQGADPREAAALFARSWAVRQRTLGPQAPEALSTRGRLALAWRRQGRITDAEQALREILAVNREVCGPQDFQLYETQNSLATLLLNLGNFAEAEELLEEALVGYVRLRGVEHADTRLIQQNLRVVHSEGSRSIPENLAVQEEAKSARHFIFQIQGANQRFYNGEFARAEADLRESIDALGEMGGQGRYVLAAQQCLASVLVDGLRFEEAIALQRAVIAAHEQADTARSQAALAAQTALAESLRRVGELHGAQALAEEAYAALEETVGEEALYTLSARATLAAVLADVGSIDEALHHASQALIITERTRKNPNQYAEGFRVRYGRTLVLAERYEEAEEQLLLAHGRLLEMHSARGPYTLRATQALIVLYESWGREQDAAHWGEVLIQSTIRPVVASAPPGK